MYTFGHGLGLRSYSIIEESGSVRPNHVLLLAKSFGVVLFAEPFSVIQQQVQPETQYRKSTITAELSSTWLFGTKE